MKEIKYSSYKPIFRETFNSEQEVRKNGWVPTDVDFSNGVGGFNGTSSKINYKTNLNGTYSLRVKCHSTNLDVNRYIFDSRGSNKDGEGYIIISNSSGILRQSGDCYINGISTQTVEADKDYEIVITGIAITEGTGLNKTLLGSKYNNDAYYDQPMDLFEIYEGTLTASEVKNLYNNTWNKEQSFGGEFESEIVINGAFDTDSDWVKWAGWTISGGKANANISSNNIRLYQTNLGLEVGKRYKLSFTISDYVSGSLKSFLWYTTGDGVIYTNGNGNYSTICNISNIAQNYVRFQTIGSFVGSIDSVSVQEINPKTLIDFDSTNWVIEDKCVGDSVGDDLLSGWDFTNWAGTATVINSNTFSNNNTQYILRNFWNLKNGASYRLTIQGNTTASELEVTDAGVSLRYIDNKIWPWDFNETIEFVSTGDDIIGLLARGTGITTITTLVITEIRPELESTNVAVKKTGSSYSAEFNGLNSRIDLGYDPVGSKAVTFMSWIKPYSFGGGSFGRIFENGDAIKHYIESQSRVSFRSSSAAWSSSANNSIPLGKYSFCVVTRDKNGVVNFYIGDEENAPVHSGVADQNSGNPTFWTTNAFLGNREDTTRTFDGLIPMIKVVEGILDIDSITQIRSETRKHL